MKDNKRSLLWIVNCDWLNVTVLLLSGPHISMKSSVLMALITKETNHSLTVLDASCPLSSYNVEYEPMYGLVGILFQWMNF